MYIWQILPEFPILCSTISSNTLNFVFTVLNRFFKLLCNKQAALFFSKGKDGFSGGFYSCNNGSRHGEKGGAGEEQKAFPALSVIVAEPFI